MDRTWLTMAACDLGRGIGEGEIDPVELAEAYLEAAAASPLRDRIFARLTEERAREEAMASRERARSSMRRSLLDGVPVSWKDLFDTAGVATEAGSALLKGRVPDRDAAVVRNAAHAGLVCLGKTHMSELAFSGLGFNPVTASPPCVNDSRAVSGGSSSGAAASVAHGLSAAGIGSDTGGSVRIPAAWNDLVGLKTTSGRLFLEGVVPLAPSFDTVGPLCRSVEDAAHLLAALEGGKPADLGSGSLRGKRLARLETVALSDVRKEPLEGFERALERARAAGAIVESVEVPAVAEAIGLSGILYTVEAYAIWKDRIEADPDVMHEEVRERFRSGAGFGGVEYVQARRKLEACRLEYYGAVSGYDAAVMPSSPILPPDLERVSRDHDYYVSENLLALRNTRISNLMGCCALTLPTGAPSAGVMLAGFPGSEERLLGLGLAFERAMGG